MGEGEMGDLKGMDMATGEGRFRVGRLGAAVEMERESLGLTAREASILTSCC